MVLRIALVALVVVGCGPSAPKPATGQQGGPCFNDGTCDDGFTCENAVCQPNGGLPDASPFRPDARVATVDARGAGEADAPPSRPDAATSSPDARSRPDAPSPPPPDAPGPTTGTLAASWSVTLNGAPSSCAEVGGVTVEIVSLPSGGGQGLVGRFACGDGLGRLASVPAGDHTVDASLLDSGNHALADDSGGTATVRIGQTTDLGSFVFAVTRAVPDGDFTMLWGVTVGNSGGFCSDISATTFELEARPSGGGASVVSTFSCADHGGTSEPLAPGDYDLVARLRDAIGDPLATLDVGSASVTSSADTDLGDLVFQVPGSAGRFVVGWTLRSAGSDTTCDAVGGATVEVDLTPVGGQTTIDLYPCADGIGATDLLPPGDVDIAMSLLDASGSVLGTAPGTTETILASDEIDIGDLVLPVVTKR